MIQIIKHKIILALLICSLLGAAKTLACDCALLTTQQAVEQSQAVFSGEVVGFEYRKGIPNWFVDEQAKETGKIIEYETLVVKVRVNGWWKGEPPTEIYLLTSSTRNADGTSPVSSCDYNFYKGETYLIFATKFNTKNENEYRTSDCLRTRKLSSADEDLKILGEGKEPLEKKRRAEQVNRYAGAGSFSLKTFSVKIGVARSWFRPMSDTVLKVKPLLPSNAGQMVFRFSRLRKPDESVFASPPR